MRHIIPSKLSFICGDIVILAANMKINKQGIRIFVYTNNHAQYYFFQNKNT